jgi:CheY-like chemotaxis protein
MYMQVEANVSDAQPGRGENSMSAETTERRAGTSGYCLATDERVLTGSETILFVEDEAFVREVTCEVLRSAGYRVLTARNALEGAQAYDLERGAVELLLTDVILPGENGRALAARLKRANPDLRVLFVTGYAEQMGLRRGEHEECLAKPFSSGTLLQTIRRLVDSVKFRTEASTLAMPVCDSGSLAGSLAVFEAAARLG